MSESALISRLNELPRIQQVLQELLEMVNQDDVDFGALSAKMAQDQVLCARLLRMANSAHFGGTKKVSSINDAIIRVGSGPVRTLVVASVLSGAFPKLDTMDLNEYWANTFEVATIASKLGAEAGLDANEVFTTAVLHNIGELMIHSLVPEQATEIEKRVEAGEERYAVQQEVIGRCSPGLGAKLAKAWKFPDDMVQAIKFFNSPEQAEGSTKLASTIHFARDIHDTWDDIEEEKQKSVFLAEHIDARVLHISAAFRDTIDKIRGNGRELAAQLA
ncbi:HDOD domain-containing protein [Vibrio sp. T187]|uniref:HDOD domain-containing protein n=1 Tax=Vibrio TaxID=662 RepID=UPI0010C97EAF|nr:MULTISPECIES: HDOD domain-containing protein [Vibrio]MBW3695832.1 HDOD domain-containing protein [Vibrio sp. T187]